MIKILARLLHPVLLAAVLGGCAAAIAPALFVTGVGTAAYVINDRRAPETMVADQRIQKTAASRMEDELKNDVRVDVISYNRNVLLLGEARTEEVKERAAKIVAEIRSTSFIRSVIWDSPAGEEGPPVYCQVVVE